MPSIELAVVGATGTIGQQILRALEEKEHPAQQLTLFASEKGEVDYAGESLEIEQLSKDAFTGITAAVIAVPAAVAKPIAQQAQASGAWALDLSGSFRTELDVPLVFDEADLAKPMKGKIVGLAGAATQGLVAALEPLKPVAAQVTVLSGAAQAGQKGLTAFERQTAALLNAADVEAQVFPHRLAFNLVPQVGAFAQGHTADELALKVEAARRLGPIPVATTLVSVPIFHGTMLIISAQVDRAIDADGVRALLKNAPNVKLLDTPAEGIYPMPMLVTADPAIHVGRVRVEGKTVQLVVALDNAGRVGDLAASLALALTKRG